MGRSLHWHHVFVNGVLIVAILASGLYVPVFHHGHQDPNTECEAHRVVHSHGGRLHVHVYHHDHHHHHHHETDRHGHSCHDHDDCKDDHEHEHPETDHAPDVWLCALNAGNWQHVFSLTLTEDVGGGEMYAMSEPRPFGCGNGRAPPGRVFLPDHLSCLRSVILRL